MTNILRNIDISIRKKGDFHPLGRLPIHRLNLGVVQEQFVLIDIVIFFIVPGCVLMLHWSAMVSATMRPTMQTATMMVGTAVL